AGADEERAETARLSSFIGAIAIGDLVKVQDDEVGDGTTSVTVLAAELLRLGGSLADSYLDEGFLLDKKQLIYNYPEQLFGAAGVMAIEHADFAGVERLALVTGGEIASTFDHPELVKGATQQILDEAERQVLLSAAEAAEVILRVDNIIK
uniref:T-complex protein 1 subunit beta (Fragments) n=1 Tax=Mesocricetus auratus TaxID=10036 RepID=TCPB_MESAU|nr:RecName: Full=T-complex protein 1 subunit beta; Short=TCP-1-beta; AltName: Full=CCT-beta [Mesocricetus auratus]